MTAPRAAIVFNASAGSDTAASGLGPASAISGTAAAHTGGSASTTITLTGSPDLSGVQAGDLLWLKTASGRQFSVIASADNSAKTVTVDDSFTIAEASAVNYAIGGKRATWDDADSRNLRSDAKAGWIIETETDQTISSVISGNCSGSSASPITWRGSSGALRTITQSANASHFNSTAADNPQNWSFSNLKFANSNATKTAAIALNFNRTIVELHGCVLGDAVNRLLSGYSTSSSSFILLEDCDVVNCTGAGLNINNGRMYAIGCSIRGNGSNGITAFGNTNNSITLISCIVHGNAGSGLAITSGASCPVEVYNSTFHGNAGNGITFGTSSATPLKSIVVNTNFTANGGYGMLAPAPGNTWCVFDYNNFGTGATANTSGNMSDITAGAHDLNVDPQYTDAANGDFSVGTNVQAKGFPDATRYIGANQSATRSYVDIGAAQRQEAAGGGSRAVIIGG